MHMRMQQLTVCNTKMTVFIAACSLTPANPFRVAELYGQFTLFHAFIFPLSVASRVIPTAAMAKHHRQVE